MRQTLVVIAAFVAGILLTAALMWFLLLRPREAPAPAPQPSAEALAPPADLRFIDRFESIDRERYWVSDRGPNGTWMENEFRARQLQLEPHGLTVVMEANAEGARHPYRSGEFITLERYLYGYFEARMRVPRGPGIITGLFTYVVAEDAQLPQEIDIEFLGLDTTNLHAAFHVNGRATGERAPLPFDASRAFHTYGFEWTPTALRWYVDNDLIHEMTGPRVEALRRPQNFNVNLWSTEELHQWAGRIEPEGAPWRLEISCLASAESYPGRSICPATP